MSEERIDGFLVGNYDSLILNGGVPIGIEFKGTYTTGISITGACSTAQINLAHTMAAYDDQCILVTSSCTATDGSSQAPIKSSHTMSGAGATGGRAEFNCTFQPGSSGAAGGWTNALKANFTFGSNATGGTGLHTAFTAEMSAPNATVSGGEFACLDMQLGLPASHVPQAKGLSFFTMNPYTTPATMDTYGTLFALYGVTGADNKMFDDSVALNNPQIEGMLRIRILDNYWYIPLCDDPDGAA